MKVLLYDVRWGEDLASLKFQASSGTRYGEKIVRLGDELSLEVASIVRCAGYSREDKWFPCESHAIGKRKCDLCKNREGQYVYTMFDGFNSDQLDASELEKIAGPHWVYLALFEKEMIKVGVSKQERKILRQLEQGSFATLFIASTDNGVQARQIETTIRQGGLQDKVFSSQKKESLMPILSPEEAKEALLGVRENFGKVVERVGNLSRFWLKEPEFFVWKSYYGLEKIEADQKPYHPLKLEMGEWVSGKIVGMKGPFILLDTSEELVSICSKDLLGRDIEFEKKSPGMSLAGAFQGTLF